MRLRSLSVALLAGVVLVPTGASAASAADTTSLPRVSGMAKTYKNSEAKRLKRLQRTATAPTAPTAPTAGNVSTAPAPAPAPVVAPAPAATYSDRVLALTNVQRSSHGLRPLSFSTCADGFANRWAGSLAAAGTLSHQSMGAILDSCRARSVGENVAYGNVSPEEMVRMWMDSPGHRANILNPGFTHLGVGEVTTSTGRVYGVQVFLTL